MGANVILPIALQAIKLVQDLIAAAKIAGLTDEEAEQLRAARDALNQEWADLAPPPANG